MTFRTLVNRAEEGLLFDALEGQTRVFPEETVGVMEDKTRDLLKKFEQENEIYVGVSDNLTFWILTARIRKTAEKGTHHLHFGRKYVSGPNMGGNVLVIPDQENSDAAFAESWDPMETIDEFVVQALPHIRFDQEAEAQDAGCGTGCS